MKDMVKPVHRQLIGLVLADRSPQSPMALALQECAEGADVERRFEMAVGRSNETSQKAKGPAG